MYFLEILQKNCNLKMNIRHQIFNDRQIKIFTIQYFIYTICITLCALERIFKMSELFQLIWHKHSIMKTASLLYKPVKMQQGQLQISYQWSQTYRNFLKIGFEVKVHQNKVHEDYQNLKHVTQVNCGIVIYKFL